MICDPKRLWLSIHVPQMGATVKHNSLSLWHGGVDEGLDQRKLRRMGCAPRCRQV